nr:uncharacterized protein LOC127329021 [Lolium perenne]
MVCGGAAARGGAGGSGQLRAGAGRAGGSGQLRAARGGAGGSGQLRGERSGEAAAAALRQGSCGGAGRAAVGRRARGGACCGGAGRGGVASGERLVEAARWVDHLMSIPRPGHAALVLEVQIDGFTITKVFMDGGSGLNLLFTSTMKAMGITANMLQESDTGFHGIVPTLPAYPLGKLSLNVVFGKPDNFRREGLEFEVVNWKSQYHAIFGRPA